MATNTSPDNLLKPQVTDQIAPLETVLSNMQDSVQTALTNRNKTAFLRYTTKAAMDLVPGTDVGQHASVYADLNASYNGDYAWSGTTWVIVPRGPLVSSINGVGSPPTPGELLTKIGVWSPSFSGGVANVAFDTPFPTKCVAILLTLAGGPHTGVTVFNSTLSASGATLAIPNSYSGGVSAVYYVAYGW